MTVMSVKRWDQPGIWTTNWSGLVVSNDNGENWRALNAFRPNGGGNKKFQMGAFLKVGKTIYYYGTPGRPVGRRLPRPRRREGHREPR